MNKWILLVALITSWGLSAQQHTFNTKKGYVVHGVKRRASSFNSSRVDHLYQDPHESDTKFFMHYGDMTDSTNLIRLVQKIQSTEIYNFNCRVVFEF